MATEVHATGRPVFLAGELIPQIRVGGGGVSLPPDPSAKPQTGGVSGGLPTLHLYPAGVWILILRLLGVVIVIPFSVKLCDALE